MVIPACTHPCDTITFIHSLTRIHLLQLKFHNIWMKFFWSQKVFHLTIKEVSTLKSLYKLFLIKLFSDISDSSFLLDSWSKAKIFPNFSTGNSFLHPRSQIWIARLSDRCHFISYCKFSCLKKANAIIFKFSVLQDKNKCFW